MASVYKDWNQASKPVQYITVDTAYIMQRILINKHTNIQTRNVTYA